MCAPAAPQILADLGSSNMLYATALVSIWELGEGFGPLLIGPLSEVYGRVYVYNAANIMFIIFNGLAATSNSLGMLIAIRFFNGVGVASVTLNPAIIGDMFVQEERGRAMSFINLPSLLGPVCGPIMAGYLQERAGWRWLFGFTTLFALLCEIFFLLFFRETYSVTILRKKAAARRAKDENQLSVKQQQLHSCQLQLCDPDHKRIRWFQYPITKRKMSVLRIRIWLRESIGMPIHLLFHSPIIACVAAYLALVYGYIYIFFTTLANVFETGYGFPSSSAGLTFTGIGLGIVFGVIYCSLTLDRTIKAHKAAGRPSKAEHRLVPLAIGSILLPIGLFVYGWTVQAHVHWIAPIVASGLVGAGLVLTLISSASYLIDAYPLHGASAMAAIGILRSLAAAGLPLVGPPLFEKLGLGWGNSVLGFIAAAFIPGAFLLMVYGEKLRKVSS